MAVVESSSPSSLCFLKLGGSLITDKTRRRTPRTQILERLAQEIAEAHRENPPMQLVIGHGAGSFAHVPALRHGTRQGVRTPAEWQGFIEVWREAVHLNRLVMQVLHKAGLPALALQPSAAITSNEGRVVAWDLSPLRAALGAGLLPVIYGDVVFDASRGGTILSTEDLFAYLARHLHPARLLLAGLEPGVWADYPSCTHLLNEITPDDLSSIAGSLGGSAGADVTGGMASKVQEMALLAEGIPGLEVVIFSGAIPGAVKQALSGMRVGTVIRAARSGV